MPSTSKSQQRLFCMAYAVRKGELSRDKVTQSVLDIADGDMTDKEIKDFMELKENKLKSYEEFLTESFSLPKMKYVEEIRSRYGAYEIYSDDRKWVITCTLEPQLGLYYYEFDEAEIVNGKRISHDGRTENMDVPFDARHFAIFSLNFIMHCEYRRGDDRKRIAAYTKAAEELRKLK